MGDGDAALCITSHNQVLVQEVRQITVDDKVSSWQTGWLVSRANCLLEAHPVWLVQFSVWVKGFPEQIDEKTVQFRSLSDPTATVLVQK